MKRLSGWLLAVSISTMTPTTEINVFNVCGEWTDVVVSTGVSVSSCAYVLADGNNCYFSCLWPNGQQSSSKWVGSSCPTR